MSEENKSQTSERRKHNRKKTISALSYSVLSAASGLGMIKDISEGGFCFVTDKYLTPGLVIKAKFDLPRDDESMTIETVAKIVWCSFTDEGYVVGAQVLT